MSAIQWLHICWVVTQQMCQCLSPQCFWASPAGVSAFRLPTCSTLGGRYSWRIALLLLIKNLLQISWSVVDALSPFLTSSMSASASLALSIGSSNRLWKNAASPSSPGFAVSIWKHDRWWTASHLRVQNIKSISIEEAQNTKRTAFNWSPTMLCERVRLRLENRLA